MGFSFRFNSSGTILFSIGEDNKLFLIDTRLSSNVEKVIVNSKQRLNQLPKNDTFSIDFYTLGYLGTELKVLSNLNRRNFILFLKIIKRI